MSQPTDLYVSRLAAALVPALVAGVLAGIDARMGTTPVGAPAASAPAAAPTATDAKPHTYATKAERAAGEGFPCTATPPCGRTNLRTAKSGASHDQTAAHWHNAAK